MLYVEKIARNSLWIMMIGTIQAAHLLKICTQRVRKLLKEGRIVGAKKVGRFWQIPLFKGMPKVIEGTRGPKGNWRKRVPQVPTIIHVNQKRIRNNINGDTLLAPIRVESGSSVFHYFDVEIFGKCKIIYSPYEGLNCGARLWLEVDPNVVVAPISNK